MARFNIDAHLHRFVGNKTRRTNIWVRQYARIETAVRRCTEFMILEGEVGDVIEFTLKLNGFQVATIRLKASGRMEVVWNTTEAKREQIERILKR